MSRFAQLSQKEIQFLVESKIGRTAWAVYCCLSAHAQNKDHSFPSINTIQEWIGNAKNRKTIEKALKELSDKGVIESGHRNSKKRWVLVARKSKTCTTGETENPSKFEGFYKNNTSKFEGSNPSMFEGFNPSMFDPIKEKRIEKVKDSLSIEEKEHLQKIQSDWKFKVGAIVYDYETYSKLTGHVLSDYQRKEVLRIFSTNYSDDHKESLVEKILNDNPFK